jgi:hypothetical protein
MMDDFVMELLRHNRKYRGLGFAGPRHVKRLALLTCRDVL